MIKRIVGRVVHLARVNGIDLPRLISSVKKIPRYAFEYRAFCRMYYKNRKDKSGSKIELLPILGDYEELSGDMSSEYFLADLYVAKKIFRLSKELSLLDVGSRLDGLVAHVAVFRDLDVLDIRSNASNEHLGIDFIQGDITEQATLNKLQKYDIISSVHALEHFGLGRYGDKVSTEAPWTALSNLVQLLASRGRLFVGTPTGKRRVLFNSHQIFSARDIVAYLEEQGVSVDHIGVLGVAGVKEYTLSDDILESLEGIDYSFTVFSGQKR